MASLDTQAQGGERRTARHPTSALSSEQIAQLKSSITGKVLVEGADSREELDAANQRWNHFYNHLKATIVTFPENEAEVATVVNFVRKHKLDLAVAGGRHSHFGASSVAGGLVIDLRKLRDVRVDKEKREVSGGGGCTAEELEVPAAEAGLHVVFGAVNATGIGGLTLGGGIGWLSGSHGLAVDNLLGVRMVLADGRIVTASNEENSDLFWALRGGGSNFGIVTEFKYRAHPHRRPGGIVYFAILAFPMEKHKDLLHALNSVWTNGVLPSGGRLSSMVGLMRGPGAPSHAPMALIFYDGTEEEAKSLTKPFWDLEPQAVIFGDQPYIQCTNLEKAFPSEGHDRHYAGGSMIDLPMDVDHIYGVSQKFLELVAKYGDDMRKSNYIVEARLGPSAATTDPAAMAYASRFGHMGYAGEHLQFADPTMDDIAKEESRKLRNYLKEGLKKDSNIVPGAMHPTLSHSGFTKVETLFGANLPRLREMKRKFDPDSMFDKWYYIEPAVEA